MQLKLKTHQATVSDLIQSLKYELGEVKEEWLSPTQVGKELNMHINTIYRLIQHGNLPVHNVTVGNTGKNYYRIRKSELEEWLEGRRK